MSGAQIDVVIAEQYGLPRDATQLLQGMVNHVGMWFPLQREFGSDHIGKRHLAGFVTAGGYI